ncbi:MAG: D-glycero-beta-D-manno-heptose-1,7-bisphosphate 7-phosphatase [Neptuniibacter caesariensis]|uniref:D,D-heptose 1,7-bisphosphate phosphatase n=1 Tax=Neptuniibacter caesariensis TaxID=207954 RepID=A0A2G6JD78_NEPCE|nr:MAG: D-glycero-beta-D-manno-heptose-1,7-bisphosphate 7-phosphatase [Neptuniibacter caesariensis]
MTTIDPSKLIILDRDGVINIDSDNYIKSTEEWIPITGSIEAIADLYKNGFTICVATNQSGLGRKLFKQGALDAMHDKLINLVEKHGGKIHSIRYCPHTPEGQCQCRKPAAGMFWDIAEAFGLNDLKGAHTVGDSLRDLQAGSAANSSAVLVRTGKGEKTLASGKALPAGTLIFKDLREFADSMIRSPEHS